MGQVDGDAYATYGDNFGDPNEEDYGEFAGYAWWSCNEGDYTSIPSGTSYVDFAGEVDCCNGSSGSAGPDESGAVTDASSSASAVVYLYADLDEWPHRVVSRDERGMSGAPCSALPASEEMTCPVA